MPVPGCVLARTDRWDCGEPDLGFGEEIGWRGLLVPELVKVTSFTKTALIIGIVWAAWHIPGIFLADLSGDTPDLYAAIFFYRHQLPIRLLKAQVRQPVAGSLVACQSQPVYLSDLRTPYE